MRATRTRIDAAVLVVAGTAVITNTIAFVLNVGRLATGSPIYVLLATLQAGLAVWMFFLARRAWRRIRVARMAGHMNVRLLRGDVVLPCQLWYLGLDTDGQHTWMIVSPEVRPDDTLRVGTLPPHTTVVWTCA